MPVTELERRVMGNAREYIRAVMPYDVNNWRIADCLHSSDARAVFHLVLENYGGDVMDEAALKVVDMVDADRETYQKAERELKIMKVLRGGPYVVQLRGDAIKSGGGHTELLMAMEYLPVTLQDDLQHHGPFDEARTCKVGEEICLALAECWSSTVRLPGDDGSGKIVHRDIKPSNIFHDVSRDVYKLGDFGISKYVGASDSDHTRVMTPSYVAPERLRVGAEFSDTSDLYSLGMVLYRMCNGLVPKYGTAAWNARMRGRPLPPPAYGSAALKSVILKACAFRPEDRYQTPQEMLNALRAVGASSPAGGPADADAVRGGTGDRRAASGFGLRATPMSRGSVPHADGASSFSAATESADDQTRAAVPGGNSGGFRNDHTRPFGDGAYGVGGAGDSPTQSGGRSGIGKVAGFAIAAAVVVAFLVLVL